MSQSVKRNADTAFGDIVNKASSRKKRARGKAGSRTQAYLAEGVGDKKSYKVQSLPAESATSPKAKVQKSENGAVAPKEAFKPRAVTKVKRLKHKQPLSDKQPSKHVHNKKKTDTGSWTISPATGGTFIDHDPIITADGQHLVLPTKDHVFIYSTSTSLLVRSIAIKERDTITGCSISRSDPKIIFVSTRRGGLTQIDLTTGSEKGRWKIDGLITSVQHISSGQPSENVLVTRIYEGQDELLLLCLQGGGQQVSTKLLQDQKLISSISTSLDGAIIAICGRRGIQVGVREAGERKHVWHRIPVSGVRCFDIRVGQEFKKRTANINVVVGLDNGAIFVYEDILSSLINNSERGRKADLSGRKLHWHRSAVRSVKWSRDGNYIISGGDETVLVIWQLETNQQQYLPHLSTSILNITVSQTGSQYALRLGDNSVMVLSTADLTPCTNIVGLCLSHDGERNPVVLDPSYPNRLLAAISTRSNQIGGAASHLQTFDIDANLQLKRQALTRNLITAVNISPSGQPLHEPAVTHMQVSFNGNWLATVDRWSPNQSDMQALYLQNDDQTAKQKKTETSLRFWRWNAHENSWEPVTRIDKPHEPGQTCILTLASNPTTSEFCSMGEDGSIKFWKPRRRVRAGAQVQDKAGNSLFTWGCTSSIQVEKARLANQGVLAYSEDGSVVSASWSSSNRLVHLIDPKAGTLSLALPDLLTEGHALMAIMGRYLLCLSSNLLIFDTITLQTTLTMDVNHHLDSFLTVDSRTNTFAIGLNLPNKTGIVSVFGIENAEQGSVNDFKLSGQIRCIMTEPLKGFVVIDYDNKVRRLLPPTGTVMSVVSAPVGAYDTGKSLGDIFGIAKGGNEQTKRIDLGSGPQPPDDLLFVAQTAVQPGVDELFGRISRAFSRKKDLSEFWARDQDGRSALMIEKQ